MGKLDRWARKRCGVARVVAAATERGTSSSESDSSFPAREGVRVGTAEVKRPFCLETEIVASGVFSESLFEMPAALLVIVNACCELLRGARA